MKKTLLALFLIPGFIQAQSLVGTQLKYKKAVFEEFTGVNCSGCPAGSDSLEFYKTWFGHQIVVMSYCPFNSSHTAPLNGVDIDFRRHYCDTFYTNGYCGSTFMPGSMINRRLLGVTSERNAFYDIWYNSMLTITQEISPINIGLASTYDANAQTLTVDVEVYFTSTVTDSLRLHVQITEDALLAEQTNMTGTPTYTYHNNMFRENIHAHQWGDYMNAPATQGTWYTVQYVFPMANAIDTIILANAHVSAFVYNRGTGEIENGEEVIALEGTTIGIESNKKVFEAMVYPNPANEQFTLVFNSKDPDAYSIKILNVTGKCVYTENNVKAMGNNNKVVDVRHFEKGLYLVEIDNGQGHVTLKLVIE